MPIRVVLEMHHLFDRRKAYPDVSGRAIQFHSPEALRRDSDNRQAFAIQRHCLSKDRRIASEAALPETVTQNRHGLTSRGIFLGEKASPCRQVQTEHREIVSRHSLSLDQLSVLLRAQPEA